MKRFLKPKLILSLVTVVMLAGAIVGPLASHIAGARAASTVNLVANFRLFGEVQRFGLGYGDMDIHFGVNLPPATLAPSIGRLGFDTGSGTFHASGVLASLDGTLYPNDIPDTNFHVVDVQFSVPFTIDIGDSEQQKAASLYIGLGDNGIGGSQGGSIQVNFDFSDNTIIGGSLGLTPDQGLTLTSVTAPGGYQLAFNPANTQLTAGASAFDTDAGYPVTTSTAVPIDPLTRAAVFLPTATATSKLKGGLDQGGRTTDALADLDVSPESRPFAFDLAWATISGNDNVTLTRRNTPPTVNALPNATINEGSAYTASGSFADPDTGDAWTATVDYGDGSGKQNLSLNTDKTFSLNHVYDDNGSYTTTVTVTDTAGASGSGEATVTVNNVPPTITSLTGPTQVLTDTKLSYNGTATDPSNADTKAGFTWKWSIDGVAAATGNPASLTFSSCGSHTVSATATDKDGGISAPASLTSTVSANDGAWQPPLYYGQYNVAKAGSVIPVKITVGCNGVPLMGLAPTIQLIQGDVDGTTDNGTNYVTTTSVSSADTTGIMRSADSQYIYNLRVPSAPSGTPFTIRVRPFGDSDPADGMYVLIKVK